MPAFIPVILSTDPCRRRILGRVPAGIAGTLPEIVVGPNPREVSGNPSLQGSPGPPPQIPLRRRPLVELLRDLVEVPGVELRRELLGELGQVRQGAALRGTVDHLEHPAPVG